MEILSDLNVFAQILTDKGYNGYFHTQGGFAGKLKDSIGGYLESCRKDDGSASEQLLPVTGFLQWDGENKPRVECCMWVKHLNGKFFLSGMEVMRKDRYGQLLKRSELAGLSVVTAPDVREAIALVSDVPGAKIIPKNKGFRHKK